MQMTVCADKMPKDGLEKRIHGDNRFEGARLRIACSIDPLGKPAKTANRMSIIMAYRRTKSSMHASYSRCSRKQ